MRSMIVPLSIPSKRSTQSMDFSDTIDLLDKYHTMLERAKRNESSRISAIKIVLAALESDVQLRMVLSLDPSTVICRCYEYGCRCHPLAVSGWNEWMAQLRSLFRQNQSIRNEVIHRFSANAQ
jgi:hypothetical protein